MPADAEAGGFAEDGVSADAFMDENTVAKGPPATEFFPAPGLPPRRALAALREEFYRCGGARDGALTTEELAWRWKVLAQKDHQTRGRGGLNSEDWEAIALRTLQVLGEFDVEKRGRVEVQDFVHGILLSRDALLAAQIRWPLREALKRHSVLLEDLQCMFEAAKPKPTSEKPAFWLGHEEVAEVYRKKVWRVNPEGTDGRPLTDEQLESKPPEEWARLVVQAMDLDCDGHIGYGEFVAYCVGRRPVDVTLHLYDLARNMPPSARSLILGEGMPQIWHSGLVVHGREYFFSSDTVHDVPGKTTFGKPTKVVPLGTTLWRSDEIHAFIVHECQPVFHRGTYDVVANNCNHFTDRLCMFLTGRHAPADVMAQSNMLMNMTTVRVLRPVLNWMLRDHVVSRDDSPVGAQTQSPGRRWRKADPEELLQPGRAVAVHPEWGASSAVYGVVVLSGAPIEDGQQAESFFPHMMEGLALCSGGGCGPHLRSCGPDDTTAFKTNEVWVRFLDVSVGPENGMHCQVVTQLVPRSRISSVDIEGAAEQLTFRSALRAMVDYPKGGQSNTEVGPMGPIRKLSGLSAKPVLSLQQPDMFSPRELHKGDQDHDTTI